MIIVHRLSDNLCDTSILSRKQQKLKTELEIGRKDSVHFQLWFPFYSRYITSAQNVTEIYIFLESYAGTQVARFKKTFCKRAISMKKITQNFVRKCE